MNNEVNIQIELDSGSSITVHIVGEYENSIQEIPEAEAFENLEATIQIIEGYSYEFEIDSPHSLKAEGGVVSASKLNRSQGRITPGIYVGTLPIFIINEENEEIGSIELEVLSRKTDYRTEYRFMLEDITEKCTDLLMQYTSPANQPFDVDHDKDPQTLYQRFAFLKSVLDSGEFASAVHRVITNPVTEWIQTEEPRDIRSVRRMNRKVVRQLAGSTNRTSLPKNHVLIKYMDSVPEKVITRGKVDTVDTPENRFIKYALETFKNLCSDFKNNSKDNARLHKEAEFLEEELEESLNHAIFQKISRPTTLPLNSPVLQRKEGYREIMRVWLMVNLAARLTWKGGEDVYKGGKRDVATLYEYWLFFKLTELLEDLFEIQALTPEKMIEETSDKLGLKLKQGKWLPLDGVFKTDSRKLHVRFSFNKTFSGDTHYPSGGSWTRSMRPDYTLSIWPEGIDADGAEEQELIVHLHFDAKYKVENLSSLFGAEEKELDEEGKEDYLNEEKKQQNQGTFKRADLLKMHAYKDAIRRTAGAYILYPGSEVKDDWKGFHEIVPGLGAFTMKPNRENDGSSELRIFLKDVIQHFLNRTSQREIHSYQTYSTFKSENDDQVNELLPEPYGDHRSMLPDRTYVLVGYYRNEEHLKWILESGLYNARAGSKRGSLRLQRGEAEANFLLLHSEGELKSNKLYQITDEGPRIFSKEDLINKGYYKEPGQDYYLVYQVGNLEFDELKDVTVDIRELQGFRSGRASALPFSATLSELMKAKVAEENKT